MCVVSMIGDHYRDKWQDRWPGGIPPVTIATPITQHPFTRPVDIITREEFNVLKKEVEELKALLKRAKEYDEKNGEPDCEVDEKMDLLRKVAKFVGVNLDDVIRPTKPIG